MFSIIDTMFVNRQNKIKVDEPIQGTQQKWKYWSSHGQADDVENKVYLETED